LRRRVSGEDVEGVSPEVKPTHYNKKKRPSFRLSVNVVYLTDGTGWRESLTENMRVIP